MSDTTSPIRTRYSIFSVDGHHGIREGRTPAEALRRWLADHETWTVAGSEGTLEVPVRWREVKHLIINNRLSRQRDVRTWHFCDAGVQGH